MEEEEMLLWFFMPFRHNEMKKSVNKKWGNMELYGDGKLCVG
jgi:hypothetical protein